MNSNIIRFPWREPAGVVSVDPVWVWCDSEYLYIHPTLIGLVLMMATEWRNDRHLAG